MPATANAKLFADKPPEGFTWIRVVPVMAPATSILSPLLPAKFTSMTRRPPPAKPPETSRVVWAPSATLSSPAKVICVMAAVPAAIDSVAAAPLSTVIDSQPLADAAADELPTEPPLRTISASVPSPATTCLATLAPELTVTVALPASSTIPLLTTAPLLSATVTALFVRDLVWMDAALPVTLPDTATLIAPVPSLTASMPMPEPLTSAAEIVRSPVAVFA